MKQLRTFLLAVWIAFLMVSCSDSENLEITYKNFEEEVALQQNLSMIFNQDLVAQEQLNFWVDEPLIEFSPEVAGKFKWISKNELVFSPEAGFRPNTHYKAKLSAQVATEKKLGESTQFAFHTPFLNLVNTDVFWSASHQGSPVVKMMLNFNYPVTPEQVGQLASLTVNGKEANFQVQSTSPTSSVQLTLQEETATQLDKQAVQIKIAKGLKPAEGEYEAEELLFETNIPAKDKFRITQALAEYDGDEMVIHVYTNQSVGSDQIKKYVKVSPQINFKVEKLDFGFILKGDYDIGQNYKLLIDKNLKGIFQTGMNHNFEQVILFGDVEPSISFTSQKAIYLTKKGNKNIGMQIVNVPKVTVTVRKIYKNNIQEYLRESGSLYSYVSDYDYYYVNDENYSDVVFETTLQSKDLQKSGNLSLVNLGFQDANPLKGIYKLTVASSEDRYLKATKVIAVSDIGLIAKASDNEVLVFANSLKTGEPLNGVAVSLISTNNQEIYTVNTDHRGIAVFPDVKKKAPGFNVNMVTAQLGDDFNYMHFRQTHVETSRYEVGGMRNNETGLQAFIYGDRNLYRPGETIHLKTIIRKNNWEAVKKIPIKVKLLMPNGKEFFSQQVDLNEQGTYETSIKLPDNSVTGTYQLEVLTANDVMLSTRAISVEEFMPDRIKVNVNTNGEDFEMGEIIKLDAQALNLFGPPAQNRNYEVEMLLSRKYFSPKGLKDYDFSIEGLKNNYFDDELRDGNTDEEGKFSESFEIADDYKNHGLLEGKIYTTVFDETGRPVHRLSKVTVATQKTFYGIKYFDSYVKANQTIHIPLVAVNKEGKVYQTAKAHVQIIKNEWQSVLEKDSYGRYRYVSQKRENLLEDQVITLNGKNTNFPFVPSQSGSYEVRVRAQGSDSYVSQHFYAYSWGSTTHSSFEVDKEGQILIEFDKEQYEVGETANILFKAPFSGKMLVTVEKDKVFDYFFVEADKKSASYTLPIRKEYLPNVYVTATLIKPVTDNAIPLTVAHGVAPFKVNDPETKINLEIQAPEKSRSKRKQEIVIKSDLEQSDIEVTVAVVDEGILQIKNYSSPDPHKYFFQKRALQVESYDLYPKLFPELAPSPNSFGAGGYDMGKRVNPLTNKRVKLVSFWSGTLKTDSDGEVKYTVDIPQFSGDLRVMAVAVKDGAFGSADAHIKVADPVVISSALPRFMSPTDKVIMPVTLSNTTDKSISAGVNLNTEGEVNIAGNNNQNVSIPANSEKTVVFNLEAKQAIGQAKVSVQVKALNETFSEEVEMTVRPSTSVLKTSGSGMVKAGQSAKLDFKKDFLSSSIDAKLYVSKLPLVQFADNMNYLVRYPYGCAEQTISTAFPQIYFADLSKALGNLSGATLNPNQNVVEAIRKLYTMQLYNGGLAYWQGGYKDSWWATVYAAHFLMEAQKAGFDVDQQFLDRLYSYLKKKVKQKNQIEYVYWDANQQLRTKKIAPKEIFYSLYVLGMAGQKDVSTMNYYKKRPEDLSLDSKYMLACTYLVAGDHGNFRKLLPPQFAGEKSKPAFGGSFHSYIRDRALVLNVLLENDPKNAQIGTLTKTLTEQMKQSRYLSTQEQAFAMLALGKLAKQKAGSKATAKLIANGSQLASFDGKDVILKDKIAGKSVQLQASGGEVYYFWEMEGLNESGEYVEEDNHLKVRREYFDREGNRLSGNVFEQNDLVIVRLSLTADVPNVENVVITDMLPAGFEVENPRIGSISGAQWAKDASSAEHFDFRDDRVHVFTSASTTAKHFYYSVRAVSKGEFVVGPVSADAMYNGEYHSYHGAGKIRVE
ncbi:MG2 domain-containing protein [Rapidithrix thailandica]|uniref:MG2 domain-containing protein n=1 Tax=Rapidithrix thailandica TaxID=413964 RepID=A0AAW9SJM6_9BACT